MAIGQESSQFTPLQLANYIATLVNGGTRYSAHLLKEVKSSDFSQVVYQYERRSSTSWTLDPENLEAVTRGMLMVTQPGGSAYSYGFNTLDIQVAAQDRLGPGEQRHRVQRRLCLLRPLRGPGDRSGYRGGKGRLRAPR